jgi:hypothetical protein
LQPQMLMVIGIMIENIWLTVNVNHWAGTQPNQCIFFLAKLDTLAVLDKNNFKIGEWDFFIFFEKGEWDFIHTKKLGIFAVSLKWLRSLKKNGGVIRVTPLLFFVLYGIIMLATSSFHVSCFSLFFLQKCFSFLVLLIRHFSL